MKYFSYEYPEIVDEQYAIQIRNAMVSDMKSPFDIFRGDRSVMFGIEKNNADGVRVTLIGNSEGIFGYALYNSSELKEIYILESFRYTGMVFFF